MTILGIETSCDETAAAVIEIKNNKIKILSNTISSQVKIHRQYGGIVPEVAARNHVAKILPVIKKTLNPILGRGVLKRAAYPLNPNLIAVTTGPGLITSLMVGVETAKTLACVWQKPLVSVNHLEGHIYANWFTVHGLRLAKIQFPTLCLIVSGGHTELVLMTGHGKYQVVGQTLDDAAGEALDKVAKLLEIGYPGGPAIEKLARNGNARVFDFPRPMIFSRDFNFSFSGLKTAVLYKNQELGLSGREHRADMAASVQQAIIDVLIFKTIQAAKKYQVKTVMLGGGVAANQKLRLELGKAIKKELPTSYYQLPTSTLCTDNALMIALAGYFQARRNNFTPWQRLKVNPNWKIDAGLSP